MAPPSTGEFVLVTLLCGTFLWLFCLGDFTDPETGKLDAVEMGCSWLFCIGLGVPLFFFYLAIRSIVMSMLGL